MDTRQALLDTATELVRVYGYGGFSYADLSERVGIRKASIHHHFPAKEDLGLALIEQYIERFGQALRHIETESSAPRQKLLDYAGLYRDSLEHGWGCLCGMLASDSDMLPAAVQAGVQRYFDMNLEWLTRIIETGRSTTSIETSPNTESLAFALFSACQGALLISRSSKDVARFDRAVLHVINTSLA
jgi:TetR/AcrR family transcriptional regulator, transcriptional repressor for nem operon